MAALSAAQRWEVGPHTTLLVDKQGLAAADPQGLVGPAVVSPEQFRRQAAAEAGGRAVFVDAASTAENTDGSAQSPYRTIARAVADARAGDTITVRGGVYRECIEFVTGGKPNAPITLRAAPGETVTLDGADRVTGLTPVNEASAQAGLQLWRKAAYESRYRLFGGPAYRQRMIAQGPSGVEQIERRSQGDMLWLDGRLLKQVLRRQDLAARTFWVDRDKHELFLALAAGDAAEDHLIEACTRGTLIYGDASYIHLRRLHLTRSSSLPVIFGAALAISETTRGWVVEDCIVDWNNFYGISVRGGDHRILRNLVQNNGVEGIGGAICDNVLLDGNSSLANNWQRGIRTGWTGGGGKFSGSRGVTIRNHFAAFNRGPGVWFDGDNRNITIENSIFHHNADGLMVEISPGPTVFRNNLCFANGAGIIVAESGQVRVENNTLVANRRGLELRNLVDRATKEHPDWKLRDVTISRNIFADNTEGGIVNTGSPIRVSADRIRSDTNFFAGKIAYLWFVDKHSRGTLSMANDFLLDDSNETRLALTLVGVRKTLGLETNSRSGKPGFEAPDLEEYRTSPDSLARKMGAGWPGSAPSQADTK